MKALLVLALLGACVLFGGSGVGSCVKAVRFAAVDAVESLQQSDREFKAEYAARQRKKAARLEASQSPTRLERH